MSTSWHRGTAVNVEGLTVDEQLKAASLDWLVYLAPIKYRDDEGTTHEQPDIFAAYRSDTKAFLDTYRDRQPWQNSEIVETFNRFCDQADLPMTHLGSLDGGRQLYAAAKLPEMTAPATCIGDLTEGYLLLEDSHVNGRGLSVSIYANRLICTNGMKLGIKVGSKTMAHVGSFNEAKITTLLQLARETLSQQQEQDTALTTINVDTMEATLQLIAAFGVIGEPVESQPRIVKTALKLFNGQAKGSELQSAYNTAYGLLHSVTEYFNWHAPARGTVNDQFRSILSGNRANQMQKFQRQLVGCYL